MTKQRGKMSFGARSIEIMAETRIIEVVIDFTEQQREICYDRERIERYLQNFEGRSFKNLIESSDSRKSQISIVNQIVSSKNPADGKIYSL